MLTTRSTDLRVALDITNNASLRAEASKQAKEEALKARQVEARYEVVAGCLKRTRRRLDIVF